MILLEVPFYLPKTPVYKAVAALLRAAGFKVGFVETTAPTTPESPLPRPPSEGQGPPVLPVSSEGSGTTPPASPEAPGGGGPEGSGSSPA